MSFFINSARFANVTYPDDISGLTLWLDSNDINTLYQDSGKSTPVTSDADPVGCWADKSGSGYDFIQGTAGEQPTYKTGILNGKAIVRADGTEFLENLTKANWTFLHDGSPYTVIIVYEVVDSAPSGFDGLLGNNVTDQTSTGMSIGTYDGTPSDAMRFEISRSVGSNPTILLFSEADEFPVATPTILQVDYENGRGGDDAELFNGGVSQESAETANAPAVGVSTYDIQLFAIGQNGAACIGDIAEVLIYDEIISSGDQAGLTAHLKAKWGIA